MNTMTDQQARSLMKANGFDTAANANTHYNSPLLGTAWTAFVASGGDQFVNESGGVFTAPKILKRRPVAP